MIARILLILSFGALSAAGSQDLQRFEKLPGKYLAANWFINRNGITLEQCATWCLNNRKCKGFDYGHVRKYGKNSVTCDIRGSNGLLKPLKLRECKGNGCASYAKLGLKDLFKHYPEATIWQHDFKSYDNSNNLDCFKACMDDPRCFSYDFVKTDQPGGAKAGQCFLKDASGTPSLIEHAPGVDHYQKIDREVIQRIIVEVSNQKNSESKDAQCAIGFAGGVSSATITATGGQVLQNGQNATFSFNGWSVAPGLVSSGIKLKCMSATHDALNVDKLFVFTNGANFVGDVRNVFDDPSSCNTAGTHNLANCLPPFDKCCKDEVVLSMVSFP